MTKLHINGANPEVIRAQKRKERREPRMNHHYTEEQLRPTRGATGHMRRHTPVDFEKIHQEMLQWTVYFFDVEEVIKIHTSLHSEIKQYQTTADVLKMIGRWTNNSFYIIIF